MPRPTFLTIRQPPIAVPAVSAAAHPSTAQVGALGLAIRPSATSRAASSPTAYCASLAPWLNASPADITHSPIRTG